MENRVIDRIGFDNWMLETVQSIYYLHNEKMDKAHQRLLKPVEEPTESIVDFNGRLKDKYDVNRTPKRKIFRIFTNPFKKQQVSD